MTIPQPISYDDYTPGEGIICMLYGPSGSGKTEVAATAADTGEPTLILNTGEGMDTIFSPGFRSRHPNCKPDIVDIRESFSARGYIDTPIAYDMVFNVLEENLDRKKYKTYILDDLTSMRRSALAKGVDINFITERSKSKALSKKLKANVLAVQDFGMEMSLISQFISSSQGIFKAEGCNLIILAHERLYYKKSGVGEPSVLYRIRPAITGEKFPDEIPQYFDVIGYCSTLHSGGKSIYRTKFSLDNMILAKNRWGGMGYDDVVQDFNFSTLFSKVKDYSTKRK